MSTRTEILIQQVKLIRSDLADAGWIVNLEKSVFQPNQVLTWLGFLLNFDRFQISVPLEKISRVSEKFLSLWQHSVTPRYLAAIVGSLISFMPGMGDICLLMTRCLQQQIAREFQSGWDYEFLVDDNALSELRFWKK